MLRDKNLVPLSRQHQHALALCVRIERASPLPEANLGAWQDEIAQHFHAEIQVHFVAEEQVVFPLARRYDGLSSLVEELLTEHQSLRVYFQKAEARQLSAEEIVEFARKLSEHIRKEERGLFESMQELVKPEELATLGRELDRALENAAQSCSLPAPKK
ncbi:MAG TPA: hemerythrin domain-containing protein [Candidatus Sulfotelmatobacter sp.]|nr:hemerythrin domain-containing protein [Candidatus Sulfotelmatobacter sp.]